MFFPLDVPASDFDIEDIGLLPSISQIFQHYKLVILIPVFIATCKMVQPFFGVLLVRLFSDSDAWLGLESIKSVISRDVLLEDCKGMRDVIGKDLLVEFSLATVVTLEQFGVV